MFKKSDTERFALNGKGTLLAIFLVLIAFILLTQTLPPIRRITVFSLYFRLCS